MQFLRIIQINISIFCCCRNCSESILSTFHKQHVISKKYSLFSLHMHTSRSSKSRNISGYNIGKPFDDVILLDQAKVYP